jgi:hypothetical protein
LKRVLDSIAGVKPKISELTNILYLRSSGGGDITLDEQEEKGVAWLDRRYRIEGIEIPYIIIREPAQADDWKHRSKFRKMLALVFQSKVHTIFALDPTRIADADIGGFREIFKPFGAIIRTREEELKNPKVRPLTAKELGTYRRVKKVIHARNAEFAAGKTGDEWQSKLRKIEEAVSRKLDEHAEAGNPRAYMELEQAYRYLTVGGVKHGFPRQIIFEHIGIRI